MPVTYTLAPEAPDSVRVSDSETGMSRILYAPQKAAELRDQQAQGQVPVPNGSPPPFRSPMAGNVPPAAPLPSYASDPAIPAPPLPPPASSAGLPSAQPDLPPPTGMMPPRGSTAIPAPPAAPKGTQLHKAELTPGTPGQPYDLDRENARHEGLIDRKLTLQNQSDGVRAVLQEQDLRAQQQAAEDARREQEQAAKRVRYEKELEDVKRETGPMSKLGAIGSIALGLVGLFMANRQKNPGLALSRMNQSLDNAVTRDIENQRHERDSSINRLTAQVGDAQQAELMYRASVRKLALDRVKGHLQQLGEDAQTADLMRAAETEVQTIDDAAKAASFNKPGVGKYEFQQPKPGKGEGPTGAMAGSPAEEAYVDQELAKWGQAKGMKPQQVQKFWETWNKPMIEMAPAREAIRGAQQVVEKYRKSGDVPGKGTFATLAPDWWVSEEGTNVRQNIQAAKAFFQKEVSGTAVSDKERKLLDGLAEGRGNYQDIANGLGILKRIRDAQESALGGSNPVFLRIHRREQEMRNGARGRQADFSSQDTMGAAPSAPAGAPAEASDPLRTVKKKGFSRSLVEALGTDGEPTGSPL